MKKNMLKILVCLVLTMVLLGGCAKKVEPVETPETGTTVTPALPEENHKQEDAQAEEAYMAFLNGETSVTTSGRFQEDDGEYNSDGLLYGTYNYEELKAAIAEYEVHPSTTKYALVDFGQDGVRELVIRFDNEDPSFLNWVGIIKFNGEGLDLNYSYEDGYRIYSTLYTSCYLQIGGSSGAGASEFTIVGFDKDGVGTDIFTERSLFGPFAESAAYDLQPDGSGLTGNYDDIAGVTDLEVTEYVAENSVKLSVRGWNADATVREREEALIGELEDMGAQIVTEEEMKDLCSLSPYEASEVTWNEWNDGENSKDDPDGELGVEAPVSAVFPSEEFLADPKNYTEFIADNTEYQVKIEYSTVTPVTNFQVLSFNIDDVKEDGTLVCTETQLYSLEKLTPEKPLVVGMSFPGDMPNMGISYVDGNGSEQVYAIGLSGMDGEPYLTEVELSR